MALNRNFNRNFYRSFNKNGRGEKKYQFWKKKVEEAAKNKNQQDQNFFLSNELIK